ncbi:hypothetical protein BJ742DRAFT_543153 [Cladochytrium replicatum]|nr:hypothetical protein BJ742DRAFT_543153 [Cladochytrium replicatum]
MPASSTHTSALPSVAQVAFELSKVLCLLFFWVCAAALSHTHRSSAQPQSLCHSLIHHIGCALGVEHHRVAAWHNLTHEWIQRMPVDRTITDLGCVEIRYPDANPKSM